jgi:microsomal dipeptidase-like Zn-dependent dipeptidase
MSAPDQLSNVTDDLLKRGYCEIDIKKLLGDNWLRLFRAVW